MFPKLIPGDIFSNTCVAFKFSKYSGSGALTAVVPLVDTEAICLST